MVMHTRPFFNLPNVQEAFCVSHRPLTRVKIGTHMYKVIADEQVPYTASLVSALQAIGVGRDLRQFESNIGGGLLAHFDQKANHVTLTPIN